MTDDTSKLAEEAELAREEAGVAEPASDAAESAATEPGQQPSDEQPVVEEAVSEEAGAEEPVAEEELEDDVEILARPTTFARMTKEVDPEDQKKPSDEPIEMDWYILKVQSNRERSVADALRRKIAIEGLDKFFDDVMVPTEKVTEFKAGKKKVVERKLYPGYIVVHMHINDDTWFAVRETSGIGDFTGSAGKPTPMLPQEVSRIVQTEEEETDETPKLNIAFKLGDQVKVKEGNFESFEGEVNAIDEQSGRITVMINIFGRSTPVELEYWQVEQT